MRLTVVVDSVYLGASLIHNTNGKALVIVRRAKTPLWCIAVLLVAINRFVRRYCTPTKFVKVIPKPTNIGYFLLFSLITYGTLNARN